MASSACLKSVSTQFALKGLELSSSKNGLSGNAVVAPVTRTVATRKQTVCRAEAQADVPAVSRRTAVAAFVAAIAATKASPAFAAYGEAANVFGSAKKDTSFASYKGSGFTLDVPAKWNPSKEEEFEGTVYRAEDNFDATNNLSVLILPAKEGSIEGYGSPEEFVSKFSYLFGKSAYFGKTDSEGGFKSGVVAKAAFLGAETPKIDGKTYYRIEVLTTTADGDEGGKHQLIAATVNDGKLYLVKAQAGDKRWFKGAKKFVVGAVNSFKVA